MKTMLIAGALVTALGTSAAFAASNTQYNDGYQGKNHKPYVEHQNRTGDDGEYHHNKGPKDHQKSMMNGGNLQILADLTGKDVQDIRKQMFEKKQTPNEFAKEAGVYDKYLSKKVELAKPHLDRAVADGRMSQKTADSILQDIRDGKEMHQGPRGDGPGFMHHQQNAQILADLTGRSVQDLQQECRDKHVTLSQIAKDANVFDQYKTQKYEQAKTRLSQEVANGQVTQERADEILTKIQNEK